MAAHSDAALRVIGGAFAEACAEVAQLRRDLEKTRAERDEARAALDRVRHCPTCRCGPIPACATPGCGHLDVMHDLPKRKGGYVRTGCSVSTGPKATPCPCTQYTPRKED